MNEWIGVVGVGVGDRERERREREGAPGIWEKEVGASKQLLWRLLAAYDRGTTAGLSMQIILNRQEVLGSNGEK